MRIVFCGVGAIGSTAATLCRNLTPELAFVDFDRVESKNLTAQSFVKQSVGRNKAEALRLQLLNFYGISADAFPVRLDATNVDTLCTGAGLVVDCFDNAASRRVLSEHARARRSPLVHAAMSADGTFGIVRWDERFEADDEDTPGQATCENGEHLPLVGMLAAAVARVIQDFVVSDQRRDVMVTLSGASTSWSGST